LREERWSDIKINADLAIKGSSFFLRPTDVPVSGYACLSVRLRGIARGHNAVINVSFPQLEYSATPTSRSTTSREADRVSLTVSDKFYPDYGRVELKFKPLYNKIPMAAGHQLLVDTRDSSGRNGFWIAHKANGLFEFGTADNLGSSIINSASVIPLQEGDEYILVARWNAESKNMRLDMNGVKIVEKTMSSFTNTQVLTSIRFGTRYDGQHRGSFQIISFKHEQVDDE
jgi:hypothetical protein